MEKFFSNSETVIEDAKIISESSEKSESIFKDVKTWDEFTAVVLENEITDSAGQPYDNVRIETSIEFGRAIPFNLSGFTRKGGLREAAAKLYISEAETFEQLSILLDNITTIQSSSHEFTVDDIKQIIQDVIDKKLPVKYVTRNFGLQDAVIRCIENV